MLKCSNILEYQDMSQGAKCPNTPKSKCLSGQNISRGQKFLIPKNCILLLSSVLHLLVFLDKLEVNLVPYFLPFKKL